MVFWNSSKLKGDKLFSFFSFHRLMKPNVLSFQGAQDKLQSYIDKYDLTAGFTPETRDTGVEDDPDTEVDESKETFTFDPDSIKKLEK